MSATDAFFIRNTNMVELDELRDNAGVYLNAATVEVTIKDSDGVNVVGETWPVSMVYVAASNGTYRGFVSSSVTVLEEDVLKAIISATDSGLTGEWNIDLRVVERDVD